MGWWYGHLFYSNSNLSTSSYSIISCDIIALYYLYIICMRKSIGIPSIEWMDEWNTEVVGAATTSATAKAAEATIAT